MSFMNEAIAELGKQAPALAICALLAIAGITALLKIVSSFLKHIRELAVEFREANKANAESSHTFHRELTDRTTQAINHVAETMERGNQMLGRAADVIDRGERLCERLSMVNGKS